MVFISMSGARVVPLAKFSCTFADVHFGADMFKSGPPLSRTSGVPNFRSSPHERYHQGKA